MSSHLAFLRTHQVQKLETAIEAFDLLQFDLDGTGTRHKSFKVISHTSFGISSNLFQSCKSLHTVSALVEYSPRAHYANQCQGASGKDGSKGKAVSGGTCNVNFSVDDTIRYKGSKIKKSGCQTSGLKPHKGRSGRSCPCSLAAQKNLRKCQVEAK